MSTNRVLGIVSLASVVFAYAATGVMLTETQLLSDHGINIDIAAWVVLILMMFAFALGMLSRSTRLGLIGAIGAILLICMYLFQLMRPTAPESRIVPPVHAAVPQGSVNLRTASRIDLICALA